MSLDLRFLSPAHEVLWKYQWGIRAPLIAPLFVRRGASSWVLGWPCKGRMEGLSPKRLHSTSDFIIHYKLLHIFPSLRFVRLRAPRARTTHTTTRTAAHITITA